MLLCINEINGPRLLQRESRTAAGPTRRRPAALPRHNGDNLITALDVLVIINALNARSAPVGEGEAAAFVPPVDVVSWPTLSLAGSDAGIAAAERRVAWSPPPVDGQRPGAMDSRLESAAAQTVAVAA